VKGMTRGEMWTIIMVIVLGFLSVFVCWAIGNNEGRILRLEREVAEIEYTEPGQLIEIYEQRPAGVDEIWWVVRWWHDGSLHEEMVRSTAARDRLIKLATGANAS